MVKIFFVFSFKVTALARFGAICEDLLPNILVLLNRCQLDTDDEVRDRAIFFKSILEQQKSTLNAADFIIGGLRITLFSLEKALHNYTLSECVNPFNIKDIPNAEQDHSMSKKLISPQISSSTVLTRHEIFAQKFSNHPEMAFLGPLFKSSSPIELTETEAEYYVQCIKHVFESHIVLQFDCTNTLIDQLLEQVSVNVEFLSAQWDILNQKSGRKNWQILKF